LEQRLAASSAPANLARADESTAINPTAPRRFALQSWLMPRLATAAMLALLLVGAALLAGILSGRNPGVGTSGNNGLATATLQLPSVDNIRANASKAMEGNLISSLILTETATASSTANPGDGKVGGQRIIWFQSPNLWRIETSGSMLPSIDATDKTVEVSGGKFLQDYDANQNTVSMYPVDALNNPKGSQYPLEGVLGSNNSLGWLTSNCYHPGIVGSDIIAGRPTYRIELGHFTCEGLIPTGNTYTIWVDKENYLILKSVTYVAVSGGIYITTEATGVQYNVPIDPATFTYTPPPNTKVYDYRNGELNKQALQQKLNQQMLDTAAKQLGMTADELKGELAKGATLAKLAKSKGISEADLKAAVISAVKPGLDNLVATGQLTQDEEDKLIGSIENTDLSKPISVDGLANATHVPADATPSAVGTRQP